MLQNFNGNFIFQIPIEGFDAENLFNKMQDPNETVNQYISDWGISQCTLEDVFMRICKPALD